MNVKCERMSPVSVKEEESSDGPSSVAAADDTTPDRVDSDVDADETSDAEMGDKAEQKPMSHQQAMEYFKDALAEIIVVCHIMVIYTPYTTGIGNPAV